MAILDKALLGSRLGERTIKCRSPKWEGGKGFLSGGTMGRNHFSRGKKKKSQISTYRRGQDKLVMIGGRFRGRRRCRSKKKEKNITPSLQGRKERLEETIDWPRQETIDSKRHRTSL